MKEELTDELMQMYRKLDNLNVEIRKLTSLRSDTQKAIAEEACPFRVGDRITNGKEEREVSRILFDSMRHYEMEGKKIKKDKTPYLNSNRLWGNYMWTKVED